jgi:1,3-beta-glucanosyltransferase GAS3
MLTCAQLLRLLTASIALASTALASVNPVIIQGQEFVDSVTKDRVMIIGVEYGDRGKSRIQSC